MGSKEVRRQIDPRLQNLLAMKQAEAQAKSSPKQGKGDTDPKNQVPLGGRYRARHRSRDIVFK